MVVEWYPASRAELNFMLEEYLNNKVKATKNIHGLIVPHAGYEFSGAIAGKAYSLLKGKKYDKVIILGPSHYKGFKGIKALKEIITPFGKAKITKNDYEKLDYEHSIQNQFPFIQKILPKAEILPLVVGQITLKEAEEYAKKLITPNTLFIISTDLSHFLPYAIAETADKKTINIIATLDFDSLQDLDACGIFPLLIGMKICELRGYKPKLAEYKNSGDVTGDKNSVVGYASFWF
ncbi:MAG: AmmeMemoRadiSam system protein B [Candidatus ainarchaeum sp.]|nr:AmmeMemoRadiSam system protein B [Candidatus ainarchaeum sp.]